MNGCFPHSIPCHWIQQTVGYKFLLMMGVLTLAACQPAATPPVATLPAPTATNPPMPTVSPSGFTYGVTVLDAENNPVPNAHVLIEIEGQAPLDEYADANGYARIVVPATHAERPGRLTVNAQGYEVTISNIDLYSERLPDSVLLTAKVVGNTVGFCPDNLTFATGFAAAGEDETLVVVSNFADTVGNDPRNLTFDLVERMRETLAPHPKIRVERLNCAIKQQGGSDTAMRIGSRSDVNASIVLWGIYVEPPDPEVRIYFDIVKEKETYLGVGFDQSFSPQAIQPSMFDFKTTLGTQVGEVVAFAAGLVLFNAREHLAAEPLFTTAIAAVDEPMASEFARALHYYRGANYLLLGRALEAKDNLLAIVPQREPDDLKNDDLYLSLLNAIGYLYYALGDTTQALDYYNQALPLRREAGDKAGEATILNNIGGVYSDLGDKQQALDYFNKALPLRRAVGDKIGEAATLSNIGRVYSDLGDKQQALDYYNQALDLIRQMGDKAGEATTLNNIGRVYSDLGDKQQALNYYNQALPLRRVVGNKVGEATTLNNLGLFYSDLGDKQQALNYYNQALALSRAAGDRAGEATTLNNIGAVYYDLGDKQQALNYYNQALALSRAVGDRAGEATTLNNIGAVYYALGDMEKALANTYNAADILSEIGDTWSEVMIHYNIAFLHLQLGNLDAAADAIEIAITLATKLDHPNLPDLQALLAEIKVQRGK